MKLYILTRPSTVLEGIPRTLYYTGNNWVSESGLFYTKLCDAEKAFEFVSKYDVGVAIVVYKPA